MIGTDVLKSLWPPTRPDVENRLDEIKFQEMSFCDVINRVTETLIQPDSHEENVMPPDGHSHRQIILLADGLEERR